MKSLKFFIFVIILSPVIFNNCTNMDRIIKYADGNGNVYIIYNKEIKTIEYKPVKPLYSSSGIYDGGNYTKKRITDSQYKRIVDLLKETIEKKDIQIGNRLKGSGAIITEKNGNKIIYVIRPGSKEIKVIEKFLKEIIR